MIRGFFPCRFLACRQHIQNAVSCGLRIKAIWELTAKSAREDTKLMQCIMPKLQQSCLEERCYWRMAKRFRTLSKGTMSCLFVPYTPYTTVGWGTKSLFIKCHLWFVFGFQCCLMDALHVMDLGPNLNQLSLKTPWQQGGRGGLHSAAEWQSQRPLQRKGIIIPLPWGCTVDVSVLES